MDLERFAGADAMLAACGDYLERREAEHNLPLGILGTLRDYPDTYPDPPYLAVVSEGDSIALVALRTPPHGLVLSEPGVDATGVDDAIRILVDDLAEQAPDLPSASGPKPTVARFADRWAATIGRSARLDMEERIYRLSRVVPPPPVPGSWRVAGAQDRDLLADWLAAFRAELFPPDDPPMPPATLDRLVRRDGRLAYLWETAGRPVSLVVASARTASGRRIGPVYTPPADRRRGYAACLTAAASQDQLDSGLRFCFLFTDLANPTSNAIYQRIGYEAVSDVDLYRFEAPIPA
jgi:uncharacterized protein